MSLDPTTAADLSRLGRRDTSSSTPGRRFAPRTMPYRLTVDLPVAVHADFGRWTIDAEERLSHNVDNRQVVRVLLDRLANDGELSATVARTLL